MARTVNCIKLGKEAEGLDFPPYPGQLGKRIYEGVSKQAWADWLKHQTMLLNENRLNLADARARQYLARQMEKHFFGEGAEQPVPDDEDAAVVLVQVAVVHRVVHAVVAGAAEPAVEPAQAADLLRVHPVLVQQVDQRHDAEHQRREAQQRHRQVEQPAEDPAGAGLAQRGRQVVVLALVVHRVRGPQHAHAVAGAVMPVVAEVVQQQARDPDPGLVGRQPPRRQPLEGGDVDAGDQQLAEHAHQLAHHAQADAGHRVGRAVGGAASKPPQREFRRDEQQEDRRGEDDDLGFGHHCIVATPAVDAKPRRRPAKRRNPSRLEQRGDPVVPQVFMPIAETEDQ